MTDFSQLYLIWPPIAILLIGLLAGWFLQRYVLVKQMEELETQHLDLLRSAEDEMHAARDEARMQGQKLDEAQMAITVGYERLTLLDRRLKESEGRLLTAPAEQQKTLPLGAEAALRERDATIASLRNEVADVEALRLRLSDMVSELGLAHAQIAQLTRDKELATSERTTELLHRLAEAVAERREFEIELEETRERLITAESERDRALATGITKPLTAPRAMAAAAGGGLGNGMGFPAPAPLPYVAPPSREEDEDDEELPGPAIPLLSPAQLTGGLQQMLFENRIQFAPDRSDILPDSKLLLEDIADLILSSDPVRLIVEGHTERGDARACFYLSERRAVAVMDRLVRLGVPENRLMTVGYGDTRPIDENATHEGRLRNRRVEIRVLSRV